MGDTGLEPNAVSICSSKAYTERHDSSDVESDVSSDARIFSPSESAIPADLAVVIKAWSSLTEKAKKKVLDVVKLGEEGCIESASPCIGKPSYPPVEIDPDLACFIESWSILQDSQRQALLTLAQVQNESKDQSPPSHEGEDEESVKPIPAQPPRSGSSPTQSTAIFPSPRTGPFSESEWSALVNRLLLPERQTEILRLLLDGENDKQIARRLNITLPTLRTHLQRMYARFKVSNRTSLIVELFQLARTSS